jgi:hypothetical protein
VPNRTPGAAIRDGAEPGITCRPARCSGRHHLRKKPATADATALPSGDVIFSHSVGRHGRNLETDVQLVKWMLNDLIIYLMPPTTNKAI